MVRPNPGRPARSQKTNEAEHPPERKETIVEQRHVECGGVSRRFRTVGKRRLTPPHSKAPALPQQQIPRNHWEFLGSRPFDSLRSLRASSDGEGSRVRGSRLVA